MLIKQELAASGGKVSPIRGSVHSGTAAWLGSPRQGTPASCLTLLSPRTSCLGRSLGDSVSLDFV